MTKNIEKYNNYFQMTHEKSFELLQGKGLVMISAPHSVEQTRNGKIKFAEPQTGVLACLLHDELNCPIMYKTKNCNDDANYDEKSTYKDCLAKHINDFGIKFLIDLHQLAPSREIDINLGTANYNNLSLDLFKIIKNEFTKNNIGVVQIDTPFKAANPNTISSYIHNKCNIQTIQIEINSKLLYGDEAIISFEKIYQTLSSIIVKTNEFFRKT